MRLKREVDLLNYPEEMGISDSRMHTIRAIFWLVVLAFALSAIVWYASGEEQFVDGSYVTVDTPAPDVPLQYPPLDYIPRIVQGDIVYLNDTVDISGVSGWPDGNGEYRLAYYGKWVTEVTPGDSEPDYILKLPGKYHGSTAESQYRFYIDPAIFSERTGYWYQFTPTILRKSGEDSGNLRAFKVIGRYRPAPNATENETANQTESNYVAPLLEERHISDYVLAKGDPLIWPDGAYRMWLFGRVDGVYDVRCNTITSDQIESLENGRYTLVIHVAGNNTIFEASYENGTLYPGLYGKKPDDILSLDPLSKLVHLRKMVEGTDDSLYEYNVEVDIPGITINQADEMFLKGMTVLDVRGYTNVRNGTKIVVSLDEKDQRKWEAETEAVRTSDGNMSYYRAYVPIIWEELAADARNHTLVARTALGGEVSKDFKVSVMPADSYKPNATIKYIEDRNPFVPTPTPEVVTVIETKIITRTITVPVTPSQESVDAAQNKALMDVVIYSAEIVSLVVVLGMGVFLIFRFLYRSWKRRLWMQK